MNVSMTVNGEAVSRDIGKEESVIVGEVAWKNSSITGAELLQGAQRLLIPGRRRCRAEYPASSIVSTRCQPRRSHSARITWRCASRPAPLLACSLVDTRT